MIFVEKKISNSGKIQVGINEPSEVYMCDKKPINLTKLVDIPEAIGFLYRMKSS